MVSVCSILPLCSAKICPRKQQYFEILHKSSMFRAKACLVRSATGHNDL